MNEKIESFADDRLVSLVACFDRVSKPLRDRFEGDDDQINALMDEMGLSRNIVDKSLIMVAVLRECANRGLHIPYGNANRPRGDGDI